MKSNYSYFVDFLKDNKFIRWKMNPDDQLDEFWINFQNENPHLNTEIEKAEHYLVNTVLNKSSLSSSEKEILLKHIVSDIKHSQKKSAKRFFLLYSAVSVAAVLLLLFALNIFDFHYFRPAAIKKEVIMVDLLSDVDIQLITSDETVSFPDNLQMEFDCEGNVKVIQNFDEKKQSIELRKSEINKLVVPTGKRAELLLSDGSKIWVNSGSVLEFPTEFSENSREIFLNSGELYIEVAPDEKRPFFVMTSDIKIKVFGTKLNVTNYADFPKYVVLVDGQVSVQSESSEELILSSNERALMTDKNDFSVKKVDVEKYTSWKNGYLVFDNTSLSEVLQQIERYYNLSIHFEESEQLNQIKCEGKLILSESVDNVMNTIAFLSKSTYSRKNNKIYLFIND